ncbi:hypothetical protein BDV28DRAFT_155790 [Aspergillus coremiiformis]|uniref:DUF6590 domain-containing protein n=1 Tax=Aspergillus coremiiformis TaxID=138285 RepID=A0A5N6ZDR8_9EURO|nr:hypothetical protein BDV28DRAFT_155790 [Aspergillus coremiiformis]
MASDRDPRRETLRHRQGESRDPNDPVSATTGVEPSHENYTHRDYEQSPLVNRGLPTHGIMPQPSHFAGPLTSHSPGGGHASHWDSPRSAQGADELMRSFENTTNVLQSTKGSQGLFYSGKAVQVFAVLWHENIGPTAPSRSTRSGASDLELTVGRFGERIYSDIRRMVVFREQDQCCWCYPVNTYGGQGVAKPSVDPSKHAIIHMKATAPYCGPNEPRMTKDPLEVIPASYDQKLDPMSRLNFGKIYTVEHNVKVLPVGMISEDSIARFQNYARREAQLWY